MKYAMSLAAAALFCLSALAFVDTKDTKDTKEEKCDNASFAKIAACGNLTEVKMGKCAQESATNPDVKAFATKMVKEHTRAQDELREACKTSKTECPDTQTKQGKEACEQCEKLKGDKGFDAAYIAMQVECHEKAMKLYEKAAKECECEKIKEYAAKQLPIIKEHLAEATQIKKNLDAKTRR